jgi:hypothetical protein
MANSYFISHCTCKWTKKLFFYLLKLWTATFSRSPAVLKFHAHSRLTCVRNVVEPARPQTHPLKTMGRPLTLVARIGRLEDSSCQHGPTTTKRTDCVVCRAHKKKLCWIQTAKAERRAVFIGTFKQLSHKGTALGNKLKQWGDYHMQRTYTKACNNFSKHTPCTFFLRCTVFHSCIEYIRVYTVVSF